MIIDSHIHVGDWLHADFLGRGNTLAETLDMLSAAGIAGAALMPSDRCEQAALRDDMKRAVAAGWPGPLWLFPWVRPAGDERAADLSWVQANRADVTGLKIHPSLARIRVTDDAYRPWLELAEEHNLVVLVHCGRWAEIAGWAHAIDAAVRHPGARFLLAHAGGDTPPNATNAALAVKEHGLTNVWFEFSGLREYWVVERNVKLIGADRYLMGSDFPLAHPRMYLGAIDGMTTLAPGEKEKILGANAVGLFGLERAIRS